MTLSTKTPEETEFVTCFEAQWDLNYEAFFFLAANSGKAISNYHYVNSIRTSDLDQQIEDWQYANQYKQDLKQQEFIMKGHDLFSIKGDHF